MLATTYLGKIHVTKLSSTTNSTKLNKTNEHFLTNLINGSTNTEMFFRKNYKAPNIKENIH